METHKAGRKLLRPEYFLMLVQLLVLASQFFYWRCGVRLRLFKPGWEGAAVVIFISYSILCEILSYSTIFVRREHLITVSPPWRRNWRRWFFLLFTPHVLYSLWYGLWMTFFGRFPPALILSALILVFLYLAYQRLSEHA